MREVKIITPDQPIQIERLTPTGEGIGTVKTGDEAGKKGFFWNALPGELVTKYELVKNHNKFFEAIAINIENPNKDRVEPKDKHFLSTSPWQILNETAEAEAKGGKKKNSFFKNMINNFMNYSEGFFDDKDETTQQ